MAIGRWPLFHGSTTRRFDNSTVGRLHGSTARSWNSPLLDRYQYRQAAREVKKEGLYTLNKHPEQGWAEWKSISSGISGSF